MIDASGAAVRDASMRVRALRAAGFRARAAALPVAGGESAHNVTSEDVVLLDPADPGALAACAGVERADAVVIASAASGGGAAGARMRAGFVPAYWWPTGIAPRVAGPRALEPLAIGNGPRLRNEPWPHACAGLDASTVDDARHARQQFPLWDGDYLVAPQPLSGAAGRVALDAFARLCASHDGLDLVVLADPQPEFERLARGLGIGFRVHFAGLAPRDAEFAWLSAAHAVLIAGDDALSGGLVLRALERGCPVVPVAGSAIAAPIEAWLARCGAATMAASEALPQRLERILARGVAVRASIEAGRRAAGAARIETLSGRLAEALTLIPRGRRAA